MPSLGITVLKHNVPWGPFTREQIKDGLARNDFTLRYLAHAPGLKEWLPLGEVLDYVERNDVGHPPFLPPVPVDARNLPQVTAPSSADVIMPKPSAPSLKLDPEPIQTRSIVPPPLPIAPERPAFAPPSTPDITLKPASAFRRSWAFLIDATILFAPIGIFYLLGGLFIELPGKWNHISHQVRMDDWEFLDLTTVRLLWLDAFGFVPLYGAGMEASPSRATVGKRWLRIIVTDMNGYRIDFLRGVGRYAAKYVAALPCYVGFLLDTNLAIIVGSMITAVAFGSALFNSRHLAVHDRFSGTRVVRR